MERTSTNPDNYCNQNINYRSQRITSIKRKKKRKYSRAKKSKYSRTYLIHRRKVTRYVNY